MAVIIFKNLKLDFRIIQVRYVLFRVFQATVPIFNVFIRLLHLRKFSFLISDKKFSTFFIRILLMTDT